MREGSGRRIGALLGLTAAALLSAWAARAEDGQGQYAVRGAGLLNCALFVQARATRDDAYLVVAAWLDGYVTGINQHAQDTYDALSFEGTELLLAVVDQHCQRNPTDPVFGVLTKLFEQLSADRLTSRSDKVSVRVGEREAQHYVELIERMQRALSAGGFYAGAIDGELSPPTVEALKRFQESIDFEATGFPDQTTLWRLLRRED